jgi:GH25 family lysozyme M1 (1,4-beta-N-acetylmuramidase)
MAILGSSAAVRNMRLACLAAVLAGAVLAFAGASGAATVSAKAKGIDVSNWNGTINWTKVAHAGYRFAVAKATEGTTFEDGTYVANRTASEAAGVVFGAYDFARPSGSTVAAATASAVAQADYFLAFATPQPGELPPALDLEATGNLSAHLLNAWTVAWAQEVYARLGVHPFVYSSPAFWHEYLADSTAVAAAGTPLWIAHWTSASQPWVPANNWNGDGWTFWQWTDCASVPGVAHCADGDRMNGASPATVAIAPYSQDAPTVSTTPSVVGPPEAGELLSAVPGVWNGGKPLAFSFQWRRCDAAGANCDDIAGATRESYRPTTGDVGYSLRVRVTAGTAADTAKATTPATTAVSPAGTPPTARPTNVGAPVLSGTQQVGQKLSASAGAWTGSPSKFAFRWQRCNASGLDCAAIKHATRYTYTTTPDDLGSTLAVVVTATGEGGAAASHPVKTSAIAAAPLPPISTGSQKVVKGVAGNVGTLDGRAVATWQPGAVRVGLTVGLSIFDQSPGIVGGGVSLGVPGLPSTGFKWPVEVDYTSAAPAGTVLGYSTDRRVFTLMPPLSSTSLPAGQQLGSYVADDGTEHVLTRTPLDLSLFTAGAWGDPTYTSATGPSLTTTVPFTARVRAADRTVHLSTELTAASQTKLTATVTSPTGGTVVILPKGSVLGTALPAGKALKVAQTELDRPGTIRVRLRLNDRRLAAGTYTLKIVAADPWGRVSVKRFRFTLSQ